jgi:hypothetical protein
MDIYCNYRLIPCLTFGIIEGSSNYVVRVPVLMGACFMSWSFIWKVLKLTLFIVICFLWVCISFSRGCFLLLKCVLKFIYQCNAACEQTWIFVHNFQYRHHQTQNQEMDISNIFTHSCFIHIKQHWNRKIHPERVSQLSCDICKISKIEPF